MLQPERVPLPRTWPSHGRRSLHRAVYRRPSNTKPRRRLYELLKSQGMQDNQTVEFFTDGGEDVRDLPRLLNPQAATGSTGSTSPCASPCYAT